MAGNWVAFGSYEPPSWVATLYAANLQTHESITLTHVLYRHNRCQCQWQFWHQRPANHVVHPRIRQIVVLILMLHNVVATLANFETTFNERNLVVFAYRPGETVVNLEWWLWLYS